MTVMRLTCPRGHTFTASIYSRRSEAICPECKREEGTWAFDPPVIVEVPAPAPAPDVPESGGDFGGGGASGEW
jgi:uncharacterized membrane protein YgcG